MPHEKGAQVEVVECEEHDDVSMFYTTDECPLCQAEKKIAELRAKEAEASCVYDDLVEELTAIAERHTRATPASEAGLEVGYECRDRAIDILATLDEKSVEFVRVFVGENDGMCGPRFFDPASPSGIYPAGQPASYKCTPGDKYLLVKEKP